MGLAASQARLLSLTARLQDVEFKAQDLQHKKVALATQKDELYDDYCDALDATAIKVAFWGDSATTKFVEANYANVCTYNKDRCKQYALKDNKSGKMLVSEQVKNAYESYGTDKYTFAWAMLEMTGFNWYAGTGSVFSSSFETGTKIGYSSSLLQETYGDGDASNDYKYGDNNTDVLYMTEVEARVYESHQEDQDLVRKYYDIHEAETKSEKQDALEVFRDYLYSKYDGEIYQNMILDKEQDISSGRTVTDETWDEFCDKFNYYVNLHSAIKEAGGCKSIDPAYENGEEGETWFYNMVKSGLVTIQVWDESGSRKQWSDTSIATSINNNYLQEMQDETDLKKAEAKYEHDLAIINDKDTKYDIELKKLETERTAITTEMESIGKIKDENSERTFGIFS